MRNHQLIVGILTSGEGENKLVGNRGLFQHIQRKLLAEHCRSFLFTAQDLNTKEINGFCYLPKKNKWVKMVCPEPHIIYNRIPSREEEEKVIPLLQKRKIPYFNCHFFDKHEIYQLLRQDKTLVPYLPETILANDITSFLHFLSTHKMIYCKPTRKAQGTGLFRLTYQSETSVIFQEVNTPPQLLHIERVWELLQQDTYILQRGIIPNTINQRPYDFRILAHFLKGEFIISGIGVRLGKESGITTHLLYGGEVISKNIIPIDYETIEFIVKKCGAILQQTYKAVYEFSLDIGIQGGNYFLFEINGKPMTFDEPEIKKQGMENLIAVFHEQAEKGWGENLIGGVK